MKIIIIYLVDNFWCHKVLHALNSLIISVLLKKDSSFLKQDCKTVWFLIRNAYTFAWCRIIKIRGEETSKEIWLSQARFWQWNNLNSTLVRHSDDSRGKESTMHAGIAYYNHKRTKSRENEIKYAEHVIAKL